ncbi:MAG: transketolase family protein [Actinomycetota bacterium]|nr:transketolase family protein [Actinomycetota bacterium]MDI6821488.1 transketolase family protein [Actinomycetota bacterium]
MNHLREKRATREAYGDALLELGAKYPNVVVLDADLAKSTTSIKFANAYPERFIECGIAEQNMMDIAAGISTCGKVCYTGSFAIFATGRAFEQVRNTIAYSNLNVKLCPTHAGISVGADGSSHQSVEDIAVMRAVPNMKVVVPADYFEAREAVKAAYHIEGPIFIRLGREPAPIIFDVNYRFRFGEILKLRKGSDVTIFAIGIMVNEALEAAEKLGEKGISVEVINVPTIKPLDAEGILESVEKTKAVVTAEEHTIIGGLGSAIAELLAETTPTPIARVGIRDEFGQSGSAAELLKHYGLTSQDIVEAVGRVLSRKWV